MSNNLTIRIISTAWIFLATKFAFVSATNEVRFIFNNGFTTSAGASCTAAEHDKISAIFAVGIRRALRGSDSSIGNSTAAEDASRELWLAKCADVCQYLAPRTCRAKGCEGFRNLAADEEGDRNLQVSCTSELSTLHSKLDTLMTQVSASCKTYLARNRRQSTCFPDYRYGKVLGMRVWKVSGGTQSVHTNLVKPEGSVSICQSISFNIETLTEPCVDSVVYWMQGEGSIDYLREHLEVEAPYALFGDDGTVLKPKTLSAAGQYTVWMAPNGDTTIEPWFTINILGHC